MNAHRKVFRATVGRVFLTLLFCLTSPRLCRGQSSQPATPPASNRIADAASPPVLTRPGAELGATRVGAGIWLAELDSIDSAAQVFRASVALVLTWKDPRLTHAGPGPRRYELAQIWHPRAVIVNELDSVRAAMPEVAEAEPDGTVFYRQRFVGPFSQPLDLRRFPFDDHVLQIQLVSLGYSPDEVVFEPAEHLITRGIPNAAGIAANLACPIGRSNSVK
jgi:hypothetical protein